MLGSAPAATNIPAIGNKKVNIQTLSEPLFRAKGWMKLVGVMMIISGAFTALSIVGIIVAWLPIWIGVLLFQAASLVERAHLSGDDNSFLMSQAKLKTTFTITGVLMLIYICLMVLSVILIMSLGIAGFQQQLGTQPVL